MMFIQRPYLPVALVAFVLFSTMAFQAIQIINENKSLQLMHEQQDKPLDDIKKLQAKLDALATGTLKLSQQGNKNAEIMIDQLKKMGITVSDPATPAATKH